MGEYHTATIMTINKSKAQYFIAMHMGGIFQNHGEHYSSM